MLPLAIEAGMPLDVFWYDDMRYFKAYSMAYANKNEQLSYMIGARVYEAVSCSLANAFAKKGTPPHRFSDKPHRYEAIENKKPADVPNVAMWAQRIKQLKGMVT